MSIHIRASPSSFEAIAWTKMLMEWTKQMFHLKKLEYLSHEKKYYNSNLLKMP